MNIGKDGLCSRSSKQLEPTLSIFYGTNPKDIQHSMKAIHQEVSNGRSLILSLNAADRLNRVPL